MLLLMHGGHWTEGKSDLTTIKIILIILIRAFQRWINPGKNLLDFHYDVAKGHSGWLLQPIPEANSREWLNEMRSVSDANIRKSLETVFFADRPGGELQINLAELALKVSSRFVLFSDLAFEYLIGFNDNIDI